LLAVSNPKELITLPGTTGFLIGTLFRRHGSAEPVYRFDADDVEAIEATQGQHIIDRFWGRYVAVIRTPGHLLVLRDPSGALPCYYTVSRDELVLTSDPSTLATATGFVPELDRPQLARALALGGFPEERTALEDVRQILPGMSLQVQRADVSTKICWDPWRFACEQSDRSIEDHAEGLRRVTQLCVSGSAKAGARSLLGVSGGLDSSIVAACLHSSENDFACVTLKTDDPLGDERSYARALASHLGRQLFEESYALEDVDLDKSSVCHLPKPCGRLDTQAYDAAVVRVARQIDAKAIFTGNGGDNVFYMSHSARPVADQFLANGFSPALLTTVRDISRLTGATGARVILQAVRAWRNSSDGYVWRTDPAFLSDTVIDDVVSHPVHHPWLEQPRGCRLPAKAAHVAMLIRMHHSLDAYRERGGISVLHPLASQPLLEFCLQIPAWQQCYQGVDRSVARKAFRHALPEVVVDRTTKGGPQGFSFQIFHHYRNEIKERLLDGYLANERIVERSALETVFRPGHPTSAAEITRLLMLVDTEAWVRHWRSFGEKSTFPHTDVA